MVIIALLTVALALDEIVSSNRFLVGEQTGRRSPLQLVVVVREKAAHVADLLSRRRRECMCGAANALFFGGRESNVWRRTDVREIIRVPIEA